jgi:hypothetical protein
MRQAVGKPSEPGRAVDAFAQQAGVVVVSRLFLDHVEIHPAHADLGAAEG